MNAAQRWWSRLDDPRWAAVLLVICVGAVYGPSLWAPFVFDDHGVIISNPLLRSWDHAAELVRSKPLRTLTNLSFLANYQLAYGERILVQPG